MCTRANVQFVPVVDDGVRRLPDGPRPRRPRSHPRPRRVPRLLESVPVALPSPICAGGSFSSLLCSACSSSVFDSVSSFTLGKALDGARLGVSTSGAVFGLGMDVRFA